MNERDLEQVDYGYGYYGQNSPQQHTTVKIEGSVIAIALSLLALGGVVAGVVLMAGPVSKAADANVRSVIAEREARVAIDQVQTMRIELAKKGIMIQLDDHQ